MAEFCLECWNKMNETEDAPNKYIMSKETELFEGCGEYKHVIIMERKYYYMRKFRFIIIPFKIIYIAFYVLWRIIILPYLIYKQIKANKNR